MKPASLAFSLLALAALACNLGAPVAPPAPTEAPPFTAQPAAPSSSASPLDPRALDTAGIEECALVSDSDFNALLGQSPVDKVPEAEINKTACYYNFSGGQTVYVTLITDLPGKQVYDSRMQYLDSAAGSEAVTLGETALLQERDGLISIQAVVNGWYFNLESRGFDRQAVLALAHLFEARLIPYPQQAAEPTAPAAGEENPVSSGLNQCQNPYYPIVQSASWKYQLSGMSSGTFTRSLTAVRADGFDDQDVFSAGTTRQGSWACQNGDLISLTPSAGAAVTAAGVTAAYTIESNSGISFPATPQPGQEWSQNIVYLGQETTNGVNIETRNVMEMTCQAGGIEAVKVPAGEFQALRVDCSTKIDIYTSGALAFTFTSVSSAWYAPGVGMVKSSGTSNMGGTEIVLLAYSIP